ncbi:ABC1 kinase family protein [Kurthia huakuii]|uniref:ABC1 kinase family protein n=1 Tax=Kurthia huakuii TaxID=1421019 RepID=UPI0004985985|nr:AarF/ABC1/UbiB kinase family protein [Kurthia huakuii]MBM7698097.1 ubiquinone biosynthesis protein [Kurthia huakuii]
MYKKRLQQTKRFQQLIHVFMKKGFSHKLFALGLVEKEKQQAMRTSERDQGIKLREAFQELGPTFVKLGQILSTRRDMFPQDVLDELAKLQNDVAPVPFADIREIVEQQLDGSLEELFESFQEVPLAAASIGQVHMAHLLSGEEVAVKVQRPNIEQTMMLDLEILQYVAQLMEAKIARAKAIGIEQMIDEFAVSLRQELDYRVEGRNGERIARQFIGDETIHIPAIFWPQSTSKVLTMEMVRGVKVSHVEELQAQHTNLSMIAERLANAMLTQIFDYGYFHGDPHPGNIYVLPNNVVALLDFGMIGRLTEDMKYEFSALLYYAQRKNARRMVGVFERMQLIQEETNRAKFTQDLQDFIDDHYDVTLDTLDVSALLNEVMAIANRHQIAMPSDMTILGKALLTIEGVIHDLDPQFKLIDVVKPFAVRSVEQRFEPKKLANEAVNEALDQLENLREVPFTVKGILKKLERGHVGVEMKIGDEEKLMRRFDRMINQVSLAIILLAFSILMVGLIIGAAIANQTTLLWRLPVIEIGAVVATLMFVYLLFAIYKSGKL